MNRMSGHLQIFIKAMTGQSFPLELKIDESIDKVKSLIKEKEGIPCIHQKLIFMGN